MMYKQAACLISINPFSPRNPLYLVQSPYDLRFWPLVTSGTPILMHFIDFRLINQRITYYPTRTQLELLCSVFTMEIYIGFQLIGWYCCRNIEFVFHLHY